MGETLFGDLLRRHRVAAKLSQEGLAERAGLSARGISDLERGARELPRKETLRLLLQALELSPDDRAAMIAAARRPASVRPASGHGNWAVALPVALTSLIGREADIAAIAQRLPDADVRLLTLTGPGGTGKTRLALAAAARAAAQFPDGVTFVPLAPLADPALVAAAIAQGLGVRETAGRPLPEAITAYLRDKGLLLLLDNCEHVLTAASLVADLLGSCSGLTVLATSRMRLRLSGEREFPVLPLDVPRSCEAHGGAELATVPAVQLLTARAQDANRAFALTDENAPAVAAICQRLDGLPLALELAAARLKILSPEALLARLDRALPLLTGGARDLPDRQRTLRRTITWSHDLLRDEERIIFRRAGVFAGGWTVDAADAVANREGAFEIFEALSSLVDNNLVCLADGASGEPRFTMLETIREFAQECLAEDPGEEVAIRQAHARFYASQATARWGDLSAGNPPAIAWIRAEEANLRVAMAFLLDTGEIETAVRLIGGSMSEYWTVSGRQFTEARAWLERALRSGDQVSPVARAWGLYGTTLLAVYQGDLVAARQAAAEGLGCARAAGDPLLVALSAFAAALVAEYEGSRPLPEPLILEAVTAARTAQHPATLGWTLQILGRHRCYAGDLEAASAAFDEARLVHQACGGMWGVCDALMALAWVTLQQGELVRAARFYADSLRLRRDNALYPDAYGDLLGVIALAEAMARPEAAARLLGAEHAFVAQFGYEGVGGVIPHRGNLREALRNQLGDERFNQSWEAGRALSIMETISEALALAESMAAGTQATGGRPGTHA